MIGSRNTTIDRESPARDELGLLPLAPVLLLSPKQRAGATLLLLLGVGLIGWSDFATGATIRFSLFYLLPILVAAWWLGMWSAIVVASGSGIAGFIAEFGWRRSAEIPESEWNVYTRLVVFLVLAFLAARIRRDQIALARLLDRADRMARTDSLTGLANSRYFHEALRRGFERSRAEGISLAVMFLDADEFKEVNDRFGHEEGDRLLRDLSAMIGDCVRPDDVVARLGGDEFGVLLLAVDGEVAEKIARRIVDRVSDSFGRLGSDGFGVSVGLVHSSEPPIDGAALLRSADLAMYEAKRLGKGQVVVRDWRNRIRDEGAAGEPG